MNCDCDNCGMIADSDYSTDEHTYCEKCAEYLDAQFNIKLGEMKE